VLGTRGVVEGRDYRGVEVLSVLSAVPNSPWLVVTKMDKEEALEAWRFRSVTIILVLLGCFTTAAGGLLVAWQRHEKVHYRNLFQAEAARRESEDRLRYALAASETGVWEVKLDDLTVQATEEADRIVGRKETSTEPRDLETFLGRIVPEDRLAVECEIRRAIREMNDTSLECRIIREDGARRWIRARGRIRDMGPGKGRHLMGIIQDITDQKAVEAQLREAQQFSEQIVQSAQEGVVVFDTEVRYVVWNPFMERMWGIPAAEALGKHPWELFPSVRGEGTVGLLERALAGESVCALEIPWTIPPAGRQVWLDGNFGPLRSQTGEIIGAIVTLRDATQRRKAEEEKEGLRAQLLQAHKMEAVGRLAGGVAHDFNNMLGVILGHAELALEHLDSPERAGHDLQTILEAARRSTDLTGQLLAFARKQTTVPKVLDLNETVERALQMLQRLIGEDVALKWAPGPKLWRIKIDPGQIDQILANLMVNARDAIPGNGQITLETGHVTLDASYPHADAEFVPGEYVVLQVSDNGTGMDKTTLEHLFEPFYTTKDQGKGTGLGLATVYGIVKQNGGLISVYSEAGLGSTFKIYLPRCLAAAPAADRAQPEGPHCEGTETVLIVEDEMTLLTLSSRMMKQLGYTVLAAASPEEAVRCVESYAGDIDLLVTDVVMPGMNGRELCERLRQLRPALKCLYMSGYTADVIAHHGVLNEGLHFLCKPYSMKSLGEGVRAALEG
ncbi:MAG: PAS domain S-box protein, partial [Candidatus Hydrogenedentes bacterium]|nr:PAS domain S-box protein [Candidatus Hydrogenedentota bacterium]